MPDSIGQDQYYLPKTELPKRVQGSAWSKATRKFIATEVEHIGKQTPGPNHYQRTASVPLHHVHRFPKDDRFHMRKGAKHPEPGQYEHTAFEAGKRNDTNMQLSDMKRTTLGRFQKGPKETYINRMCRKTGGTPSLQYSHVTENAVTRNQLELHIAIPKFSTGKTVKSRRIIDADPIVSPQQYKIQYTLVSTRPVVHKVSQYKSKNFIDLEVKDRSWTPGPGKYSMVDHKKIVKSASAVRLRSLER